MTGTTGAVVVDVPVAPRRFVTFATLKTSKKLHGLILLDSFAKPPIFEFEVQFCVSMRSGGKSDGLQMLVRIFL